jgi:hypothetical protein
MADPERLQETLDEIAGTVEWATGFLDYLEDREVRIGVTDLEILKAELDRLRVVADAVLPGRVRDPRSDRRWYLAPDDVAQRTRELEQALDGADREVAAAGARVTAARERERRDKEEPAAEEGREAR